MTQLFHYRQRLLERHSISHENPAKGELVCHKNHSFQYQSMIYRFKLRYSRLCPSFGREYQCGGDVITTGRSIEEYQMSLNDFPDHPQGQIIEIGPGVGELVPHVALNRLPDQPKPIAIDVVDYEKIQKFLEFAQTIPVLQEKYGNTIHTWLDRIAVYTNPDLVDLRNLPLRVAVERDPSLLGKGDVVIDHWSSAKYQTAEGEMFNADESGQLLEYDRELIAEITSIREKLRSDTGKIFLFSY